MVLDFLDWSDEEEPTRETSVPASYARPSLATMEARRSIRRPRDESSDPSIEIAPATEVDFSGPMSWAPTLPESVLARSSAPPMSSAPRTTRSAPPRPPPPRSLPPRPAPNRITLVSEPWIPPARESENFDRRTTARRAVVPPRLLEEACPASLAVPLLRTLPPLESVHTSHSSFPPMVMPAARGDDDLLREVLHLRRWVRVTGALSVAALAACAVLAALLLRAHDRPGVLGPAMAAQEQPAVPQPSATVRARSDLGGVRLAVDGRDRGALPIELTDLEPGRRELRFTGPASTEPLVKHVDLEAGEVLDLGSIALEARAVEVRIHAPSPSTVVSVARHGERPQTVTGPFPRTLRLPPGTYAVFAGRGAQIWSRPLYLTSDSADQDLIIHFAQGRRM